MGNHGRRPPSVPYLTAVVQVRTAPRAYNMEEHMSSETGNIESEQDMIDRYGIIRVPADYFLYGQYRYTNLKDAVAQAKRNEAAINLARKNP